MNSNVSASKKKSRIDARKEKRNENEKFNWKNERFRWQQNKGEKGERNGRRAENRIGNRLLPSFSKLLLRSAVLFIPSFPLFSTLLSNLRFALRKFESRRESEPILSCLAVNHQMCVCTREGEDRSPSKESRKNQWSVKKENGLHGETWQTVQPGTHRIRKTAETKAPFLLF